MKDKKIVIVGGDMRQVYLANILCEKNKVKVLGVAHKKLSADVGKIVRLEEIHEADIVIGPIPMSRDNKTINTAITKEIILIEDVFKNMNENQKFYGAKITDEINKIADNYDIETEDILKKDEFAIMNAIATAEGAIKVAIENSDINLHGSKTLVIGYGRCAKVLANKLKGLGADLTVSARKEKDLALARTYGYDKMHIKELEDRANNFEFIFNTVPVELLDRGILRRLKKSCLIVDIASKPGGVDFEVAKDLGIKAFLELGIPGKVAPRTSAEIIADIIKNNCAL